MFYIRVVVKGKGEVIYKVRLINYMVFVFEEKIILVEKIFFFLIYLFYVIGREFRGYLVYIFFVRLMVFNLGLNFFSVGRGVGILGRRRKCLGG